MTPWTHEPRGFETVDPAARSDIQHCLSGSDGFQTGWCAAPIRNLEYFLGNERLEIGHVIARGTTDLFASRCSSRVSVTYLLCDLIDWHRLLPSSKDARFSRYQVSREWGLGQQPCLPASDLQPKAYRYKSLAAKSPYTSKVHELNWVRNRSSLGIPL